MVSSFIFIIRSPFSLKVSAIILSLFFLPVDSFRCSAIQIFWLCFTDFICSCKPFMNFSFSISDLSYVGPYISKIVIWLRYILRSILVTFWLTGFQCLIECFHFSLTRIPTQALARAPLLSPLHKNMRRLSFWFRYLWKYWCRISEFWKSFFDQLCISILTKKYFICKKEKNVYHFLIIVFTIWVTKDFNLEYG